MESTARDIHRDHCSPIPERMTLTNQFFLMNQIHVQVQQMTLMIQFYLVNQNQTVQPSVIRFLKESLL